MKPYYFLLLLSLVVSRTFSQQPLPTTDNNAQYNDLTAKRQITQLYRKLKAGYAFDKLARTYSQDYGSYKVGGNLGWQQSATFVPTFNEVVDQLIKGQFSKPFKTEFGYHIVQLVDRRSEVVLTRHILLRVNN